MHNPCTRKLSLNNTTAIVNVFKAYKKLGSGIFDKWKQTCNKTYLNHEITKDTYQDEFPLHANRPRAHLKTNYKRKNKNTLVTESWKNEKEVSKNRSIVNKSEVADTKKAENPLTQANY